MAPNLRQALGDVKKIHVCRSLLLTIEQLESGIAADRRRFR
jgi:hypothetical protein